MRLMRILKMKFITCLFRPKNLMGDMIGFVLFRRRRKYGPADRKILKKKTKTWGKTRKIRKTSDFGPCEVYRRNYTIDNPFLKKKRFEPKKLRHYQVHFIIERGYLPCDKVLSHLCHRDLCINIDHIWCEDASVNSRRNGCKKKFENTAKRNLNKCKCDVHEPCCFH